ncbi:MAG: hypothetical protein BWK80_56120, partial [Desulfobacteraceae bacterium IS3]
ECKNCIFARPKCKNEIFALLPQLNLMALKPGLGTRNSRLFPPSNTMPAPLTVSAIYEIKRQVFLCKITEFMLRT